MTGPSAATTPGRLRVGCSGWLHRRPLGQLRPAARPTARGVASYTEEFDTVELSATSYRRPGPDTIERWADTAPPGFVYATRLEPPAGHRYRLRDTDAWLSHRSDRVRRLGQTRGPVVVQLPPPWRRDTGRLAALLATATSDSDLRWAVEFHHPSWIDDAVFSVLADHGAAMVLHDLLPDLPFVRTTNWVYLRFQGPGRGRRPYRDRYGGQRLAVVADRIGPWIGEGADVYAYFNREGERMATADARTLRQLLAGWA